MRYAFLVLAAFLAIIWVFAFLTFHIVGAFIHILLVLAVVFFIIHLLRPSGAPR
ncbi:MAG: lmo0937 family membrane protein [Candidatus Acidiferrales bacterium]